MEFRWLAILTLWTMLIGPILDSPWGDGRTKARSQNSRVAARR